MQQNKIPTGKKAHTTLEGASRIIVSEFIKYIKSREDGYKGKPLDPIALYFEGTMGIGKTQMVRQAADVLKKIFNEEFGVVELHLGSYTGSDIQGVPIPVSVDEYYKGTSISLEDGDKGQMMLKWLKDALLPGVGANTPKYGILFLDECNQVTDNSIASILYQLLPDRGFNDYKLPEGWIIIGAGNREEDGGLYERILAPVRDRMIILEIDLDKEEWLNNYARPLKVHPAVISYISQNSEGIFHSYNPDLERDGDEDCSNYVFATPRSWVAVSDNIHAYESKELNPEIEGYGKVTTIEDLKMKIMGLVGSEIGADFMSFFEEVSSVDIEGVLSIEWVDGNPSYMPPCTKYAFAFLTNIAVYPETKEELERTVKLLLYLLYSEATAANISIIINSLTSKQVNELNARCVEFGCVKALATIKETQERIMNVKKAH